MIPNDGYSDYRDEIKNYGALMTDPKWQTSILAYIKIAYLME